MATRTELVTVSETAEAAKPRAALRANVGARVVHVGSLLSA